MKHVSREVVDRQGWRGDLIAIGGVRMVRYADDMVLLARTEQEWDLLQTQFSAVRLVVKRHIDEHRRPRGSAKTVASSCVSMNITAGNGFCDKQHVPVYVFRRPLESRNVFRD